MSPHYLFDASLLIEESLDELKEIIEFNDQRDRSHQTLFDLKVTLLATERLLHQYAHSQLDSESRVFSNAAEETLSSIAEQLMHSQQGRSTMGSSSSSLVESLAGVPSQYFSTRNTTDTLLFRLIVSLQLTLVRLGVARSIFIHPEDSAHDVIVSKGPLLAFTLGAALLSRKHLKRQQNDKLWLTVLSGAFKVTLAATGALWLKQQWETAWATQKIASSTAEIEDWNRQWFALQSEPYHAHDETPKDSAKSINIIEYALKGSPKLSIWQSQGEIRFLMLKRAMDVFYASVDTARQVTKGTVDSDPASWQMTLTAAAVASFYNITGARRRAEQATSSSEKARYLIQNAWGMVSLPALKNISLQASRFLKGAAVADRIEIAGVPCFVLSREPAPELAAAIRRYHCKFGQMTSTLGRLSTIDEQEEHSPVQTSPQRKPFASSRDSHRQRDVILHLTGGGFFAHIIASDLPFLLDWSASTDSVVICPEYSLLPEHAFPDALLQVDAVFKTLQSTKCVTSLGFEADRIVVTGESTGGNLAAALCVKIAMQKAGIPTNLPNSTMSGDDEACDTTSLPSALVLSCPVLNLALDVNRSRGTGDNDPVLPRGLVSAISDAYGAGMDKRNPLVSPLYASDAILTTFPPSLFFASSTDPLLDDCVVLNERLRCLGVQSDLRAAQNLPHAYLGLGTAGFPEARLVQRQLVDWLKHHLRTD